jgi:Ca2+-binding EF-hand superfamily protein
MMDSNQSGSLDQYEFSQAIQSHGIDINAADIAGLFKSFDNSGDGEITYDEFISVVKGPLNQFRHQIIIRVFKQLDLTGSGQISMRDIKLKFDAPGHPDVKSGKRTANEIQTEF